MIKQAKSIGAARLFATYICLVFFWSTAKIVGVNNIYILILASLVLSDWLIQIAIKQSKEEKG